METTECDNTVVIIKKKVLFNRRRRRRRKATRLGVHGIECVPLNQLCNLPEL